MTVTSFEDTLRALLRRQPFQPFEVELRNGVRFLIDRGDAVAFDGGAAAFITDEGFVHFFDNEQVRELGKGRNGTSG